MRRKMVFVTVLVVFAVQVLAGQRDSWAKYYNYSGLACQPLAPIQNYNRDNYLGFFNGDSDLPIGAECPLTGTTDADVDITNVYFYYRDNNNDSDDGYVFCFLYLRTSTDSVYTSPIRYSCAANTTTGCLAADLNATQSQWTGDGRFHWTDPVNGGASVSNVLHSYAIECTLPNKDGALVSRLNFYTVQQTEI